MSRKSRRRVARKTRTDLIKEKLTIAFVIGLGLVTALAILIKVFTNFPGPNKLDPNDERLIRPDSHSIGSVNADVTVVEFVDLSCSQCAFIDPLLKDYLIKYRDRVKIVYRHLPLEKNSEMAGKALESAGKSGQFWELERALFYKQAEWASKADNLNSYLSNQAQSLGIDSEAFLKELANPVHEWKIHRDLNDAESLGVKSAPTIFVNGERLSHVTDLHLDGLMSRHLNMLEIGKP